MAPLPLAKQGKESGLRLPGKDALQKCFALATNPAVARYLVEQFEQLLKKIKLPPELKEAAQQMLGILKAFEANVRLQTKNDNNCWVGDKQNQTDFQNLQQNIATEAIQSVRDKDIDKVVMNFAVNDEADLLRAFSGDGKPFGDDIIAALDKLLNACLAEHNMINQGGVIYEATDKGEIRKDESGKPIRAQSEKVKQAVLSEFQSFLDKKGVKLAVKEQPFPRQTADAAPVAQNPQRPAVITKAPEVSPDGPEAPTIGG